MHDLDTLLTSISPSQAKDWRAHDNFLGQRDLRMWHGRLLGQLMQEGRFRSGTKVEFCELSGKLHLVDGQHTLFGIEFSGLTQELLVVKKPVASMDEVRHRYATFGRELARTPADVFSALGLREQLQFDSRTMQSFSGAIKLLLNELQTVSVNLDPRIAKDAEYLGDHMPRYAPHVHTFLQALNLATPLVRSRLNTTYVMAMVLALLEGANDEKIYRKATKFIEDIAMNDGLRRGDATKAVVEYVVSSDPRTMGNLTDRLRVLASAWNRHLKGNSVDHLKKLPPGRVSFDGTRHVFKQARAAPAKAENGNAGAPRRNAEQQRQGVIPQVAA